MANQWNRITALIISVLLPGMALAAPTPAPEPTQPPAVIAAPTPRPTVTPTPLPQRGLISATTGQSPDQNLPGIWGGLKTDPKSVNPLAGSVFRTSPREWTVKVFNNGDETYTADFVITQTNAKGLQVRRDYMTTTLAPGKSYERSYDSGLNATSASIEVRNWRKK